MVAHNDITGDAIQTGAISDEYRNNFESIEFEKKKVVRFIDSKDNLIKIGQSAFVMAIDHPNVGTYIGGKLVQTSKVTYIDKRTGAFETLNTRYEKEQ